MADEVTTLWRGGALLGEGPAWDPARGVLWFTDIKRRRVHRYDPASGAVTQWDAPAQVGWVLPADDGALIAGLQLRRLATGETDTPVAEPLMMLLRGA